MSDETVTVIEVSNDAPFTRVEHNLRAKLIDCVKRGLDGVALQLIDVAHALRELKEGRLYRRTHKTFEAFCRDEFGLSRKHVYKRMQAGWVVQALQDAQMARHGVPNPNVSPRRDILPNDQTSAMELIPVPADKLPEVWATCLERANGRHPTKRMVRQIVAETLGRKPKERPAETLRRINLVRAIAALRKIPSPSKQISTALDLLSRTLECGADQSKTTTKQ